MARVSRLLYQHGANILHADQHQDHELGLFFMRVEWGGLAIPAEPSDSAFDMAAFERDFAAPGRRTRHALDADVQRAPAARGALLFAISALHGRPAGALALAANCSAIFPLIVSNHRDVENLAAFYGIPF